MGSQSKKRKREREEDARKSKNGISERLINVPKRLKPSDQIVEASGSDGKQNVKPQEKSSGATKKKPRKGRSKRSRSGSGRGHHETTLFPTSHFKGLSLRKFEANEIVFFEDTEKWKEESKAKLFPRVRAERSALKPIIRESIFGLNFKIQE